MCAFKLPDLPYPIVSPACSVKLLPLTVGRVALSKNAWCIVDSTTALVPMQDALESKGMSKVSLGCDYEPRRVQPLPCLGMHVVRASPL